MTLYHLIEQLPHVCTLTAHAYRRAAAINIIRSRIVEGISPCTAVLRRAPSTTVSSAVSIHYPSSRSLVDLAAVADITTDHGGAAEAFGSMTRRLLLLHLFIGHGRCASDLTIL